MIPLPLKRILKLIAVESIMVKIYIMMMFNTFVLFTGGDVYFVANLHVVYLSLIVIVDSCAPALDKAENPIQKLLVRLKMWVFMTVFCFGLSYMFDWPRLAFIKYLLPLLFSLRLLYVLITENFADCWRFWRHGDRGYA